jgi:ribosomal protein L3
MRNLKMGLATLATAAAVMVPAGSAGATDPALLEVCDGAGSCSPVTVIEVQHNNVCGIGIVDVNALLAGSITQVNCPNGNGKHAKKKW